MNGRNCIKDKRFHYQSREHLLTVTTFIYSKTICELNLHKGGKENKGGNDDIYVV